MLAENLWIIIKTECLCRSVFVTRPRRTLALFGYIGGFCNSRRIQGRLGFLTPVVFEDQHYADRAAVEQASLRLPRLALVS
ncbi:IS3 family transposase [Streptomyces sp. NPDC006978]|uniref:IS3 family transposase n=1 Tax=unclassified Streptomyces TaxID=2593676 RepID=UPI002AFDCE3F|nr:IS3 family transposase [Streptomyces sp. S584]